MKKEITITMKSNYIQPELRDQLALTIKMRSSQDQVLWSIIGIFFAANAVLLVAIFPNGNYPPNPLVGVIITLFGVLLCMAWHLIQGRAIGYVKKHEALIFALEKALKVEGRYAISRELTEVERKVYFGHCTISARKVMPMCSSILLVFWIIVFLGFMTVIIRKHVF